MNITQVKKDFYTKNPNVLANIVFNENLNKYVCFTFDYIGGTTPTEFLTKETIEDIKFYAEKNPDNNPFNIVLNYLTDTEIEPDQIEKLADLYYQASTNGINYATLDDVCQAINLHMLSGKVAENTSNSSVVGAFLINKDGSLSDDRIFYMDVSFKTRSDGSKVCYIENTFTEEAYRNNGLHAYSIKFLEAVLARKNTYAIVGESQECDVYNGSLDKHYENLGFRVIPDPNGFSKMVREVDPFATMELTLADLDVQITK